MPLAGYKAPTQRVALGSDNFFDVKGLSLSHIATLLHTHFPDLDALFEMFAQGKDLSFEPLAITLITNAPGFVANVIALSAGEDSAEEAEQLPAGIQIDALQKIFELTFVEVGGVGKFMEIVMSLLNHARPDTKAQTKAG